MANVYGLTEEQVTRLKRVLTAFESGSLLTNKQPQKTTKSSPIESYLVELNENIAGFVYSGSGGQPESGLATIQRIEPATPPEIQPQAAQITVYNTTTTDLVAGQLHTVTREPISGEYVIGAVGGDSTPEIYEGFLDTNLAASTSNGNNEAFGTLSIWEGSGSSWADSGDNITLTNRNDNLSGSAGDYVIAGLIDGELRPITITSHETGFPNGSNECDCGDCISEFEAIDSTCGDCDPGPTGYKVVLGDGIEYDLEGPTACAFETSDTVTICGETDYLSLTITGLGAGEVSLSHGDLYYVNPYPWRCLCTNEMRLASSVDCQDTACKVCVVPYVTPSTYDIYGVDAGTGDVNFATRYSATSGGNWITTIAGEDSGVVIGGFNVNFNGSGKYVKRYNSDGKAVRAWAGPSTATYSMVARNGYTYGRHTSNGLIKMDYFGNTVYDMAIGDGLFPVAVSSDNLVYISDIQGPATYIVELDADGTATGNKVQGVWAAVDTQDNIICAYNHPNHQLRKYTPNFGSMLWSKSINNDGSQIVCGPSDEIIWCASFSSTNELRKYDSDGNLEWTKTGSYGQPVVGPNGNVYATTGTVVKCWDTDGNEVWSKTTTSSVDLALTDAGQTLIAVRFGDGAISWS